MKHLFTFLLAMLFAAIALVANNPFGTGSDGALVVNSGQTVTINTQRVAVTGYNYPGSPTILVSSTSGFQVGDEVLILSVTDPNTDNPLNVAGQWETHYVTGLGFGALILDTPLENTYVVVNGEKHQVVKIPNYTTVDVSGTLTCPAWDGSTGGVLFFRSTGNTQVNATGIITASGKGYRGGTQYGSSHGGGQGGESFLGIGGLGGIYTSDPHGKPGAGGGGAAYNGYNGGNGLAGGGGGSTNGTLGYGSANRGGAGGGGGGHAGSGGGAGYGTFGYGGSSYGSTNNGVNGGENFSGNGGSNGTGGGGGGGGTYGSPDLSRLYFGSGGGSGGRHDGYVPGAGGNGGGLLYVSANTLTCAGIMESKGGNGGNSGTYSGGGGGAAGGSLLLQAMSLTVSNTVSAAGGTRGNSHYGNLPGNGGAGRVRLNYLNLANTGTITPTPFVGQLNNIYHTGLPNSSNIAGPYTVTASIFDNQGSPITSAKIFYRVNGGTFSQVNMAAAKDLLYTFTGNIPGQAINSTIEYYLTATDGTDNYILPLNAPAELFSFQITGFPPYGLSLTDLNNGTVRLDWQKPVNLTGFSHYKIYRSEQTGFIPGTLNRIATSITDTSYLDITIEDFHRYYYIVSANYTFGGTPVEVFTGESQLLVNNTAQTTVKGYAFLEARNNHANIKVKFVPISPSAVADSVYTNALGFYQTHNLIPGVYSVRLIKAGFQTPIIYENLTIIEDTDMGNATLYDLGTTVSGDVSGFWDGFYSVSGDITVPQGDSLIIAAGTIIRFLGNYALTVNGYLAANGVEGDSVVFTSGPANQVQQANQWLRIRFYDPSDDNSYLNYTKIEYANDGIYFEWCGPKLNNCLIKNHARHGLYIQNSYNSTVRNTTIRNLGSDGIYMYGSYVTAENCTISNYASDGIYVTRYGKITISSSTITTGGNGINGDDNSDIIATNCTITGNNYGIYTSSIWGRGVISYCTFSSNNRGIFLYYESSPQILNNLFTQNGYGIEYQYNCDSYVSGNRFLNNTYGIVFNTSSHYCETTITKNLFANNTNDGVHKNSYNSTSAYSSPTITYNTLVNNGGSGIYIDKPGVEVITDNIMAFNGGYGLRNLAVIETFEYNNIYGNTTGAILNTANLPSAAWNFISFNPNNNAVCDIYRNISEDPQFAGASDYSLLPGSKCINGGDVTVKDADGSISDIGAYYFDLGNPHAIFAIGFANQSVSLVWEPVANDSLVNYKVFYKPSGETNYTFFGATTDTSITVTGLTNNQLYDFTVTGKYTIYESVYAPKVSEKSGVSTLEYNPGSFSEIIPAGQPSKNVNFNVTNNGSRDLNIQFAEGNPSPGYAYFDGSGDYISYGHQNHLHGMTQFTIETWLYRQNSGHFEFIGKNFRNYQVAINSSNRVHIYKGYGTIGSYSYQDWNTNYSISANQWYHIAVTWQGSNIKLYVNGNFVWETNDAVTTPVPDFLLYAFELGRRAGENNYYLQGRLAEARLWNFARTQDQIRSTMYASLEGNETGLLGYWPLQNDFNDHSSYGVTGSVGGNTVLQTGTGLPYTLFTVPQQNYTLTPGQNQVIPITLYNRTDLTSKYFTTTLWSDDADKPENELEFFVQYGETVPATPVYFTPVASTGKPYTIVVKDAKIDGTTIAVGDEIGVFDGNLCVGAGIFNGTFNFVFTAWEKNDALGQAGFTPGNNMTFRLYDTSADLETNEADETWIIGDGTFGYGVFSVVTLSASVYNIQSVPVTGGQFNIVSFNMFPRYANAWTVFGGLESLQIVYNDEGQVLIPGYNINTIGDINFLDGFYLFADDAETINYTGTLIKPEDWNITVKPNKWNYIAMLNREPVAVTDVFAGLESSISIVQNAAGASWIPSQGINTLINMHPGTGYKIALSGSSPLTFSYPPNGAKASQALLAGKSKPEPPRENAFFNVTETGLPYAVILKLKQPEESLYSIYPGDEIALFDGNQCVGSAVYNGIDKLLITAWEKEESMNLPGFTEGHVMTAQVYRHGMGTPTRHTLRAKSGTTPLYGESNYGNVILELVPANEEPFDFTVRPNPFKDITAATLRIYDESNVKVAVYDNTGRLLKSLANDRFTPETYRFEWDGTDMYGKRLSPGIYLMMAETPGTVITEKVVILQ